MLALCLLQLFAPDLFRLLRRRPLIWQQWLMAYLPGEHFAAAFAHARLPGRLDLEVSDDALFDWAARGNEAGAARAQGSGGPEAPPRLTWTGSESSWLAELGRASRLSRP